MGRDLIGRSDGTWKWHSRVTALSMRCSAPLVRPPVGGLVTAVLLLLLLLLLGAPPCRAVREVLTLELSQEPLYVCPLCPVSEEQAEVIDILRAQFPTATVVWQSQKLVNTVTVRFPRVQRTTRRFLQGLTQVTHIYDAQDLSLTQSIPGGNDGLPQALSSIGVESLRQAAGENGTDPSPCPTGLRVRVAVLDTGVDYTHAALGGPGTTEAYQAAVGHGTSSPWNHSTTDGLFPTARVVAGYDFVGETYVAGSGDPNTATRDDDPIDSLGHGTSAAYLIARVAPDVQLVALKVCGGMVSPSCPDFAVVQALEYALDPNQDGDTSDAVHIVSLSLSTPWISAYYSVVGKALEQAYHLGILPIVSAGNFENVPFVMGGMSASPNALVVAANDGYGTMATYSARGPGETVTKPDLSAPGGPFRLAKAGSGDGYQSGTGTSFASPLVAGAAALLKQKCMECSPFAIRTILMNNAERIIQYNHFDSELAPISWGGSGQVRVDKALNADFWAFVTDDIQPIISLGVINAAHDAVISRTIRIVKLSRAPETLQMSYTFRDTRDALSGAVRIQFSVDSVSFPGDCLEDDVLVQVQFSISSQHAPPNVMTTNGPSGKVPFDQLDRNELDGWIIIRSVLSGKDIVLPFHMILRQAANVRLMSNATLPPKGRPSTVPVSLMNDGAGKAQVDVFELLFVSQDEVEDGQGSGQSPSDFRYIGYRAMPYFEEECDYVVEFAYNTWERIGMGTLATNYFLANIVSDGVHVEGVTLLNGGPFYGPESSCQLLNRTSQSFTCTGFTPDHGAFSRNVVVRACSNDLGLGSHSASFNVSFETFAHPRKYVSDTTRTRRVLFPGLNLPSFDIMPGETVSSFHVKPGSFSPERSPLGLMLIVNSFRNEENVGAATSTSEVIVIAREDVDMPDEQTIDETLFSFPVNTVGPSCTWSAEKLCRRELIDGHAKHSLPLNQIVRENDGTIITTDDDHRYLQSASPSSCPLRIFPRLSKTSLSALDFPNKEREKSFSGPLPFASLDPLKTLPQEPLSTLVEDLSDDNASSTLASSFSVGNSQSHSKSIFTCKLMTILLVGKLMF